MKRVAFALLAALPLTAAACAAPADAVDPEEDLGEEAYTSASARLYDFEFDGELLADTRDAKSAVSDQMLFTIGQLNGEGGVARLDKIALSNVKVTDAAGKVKITYHAKLPVSWPKAKRAPRTFNLLLPRDVTWEGQDAFFKKHEPRCTDPWAHDNETGIYWYYYRPATAGCDVGDDVVKMPAKVRVSPENSVRKYPEMNKIWENGSLDVVVIFGKVEDGATTEADRGIWSYNLFVSTMKRELPNATTLPADVGDKPGIAKPETTIRATLANGGKVNITAFLVDNVREGGPKFEARYNELSTDADLIVYNGHAGLGQNVRKLASMGKFKSGQYQIFYMNGCDTFAYVDGSMAQTRARLNPDDPTGTKYMEILTNSMPPNWDSLPLNTMTLVRALADKEHAKTYTDILASFDQSGLVTVTGEEDNKYRP